MSPLSSFIDVGGGDGDSGLVSMFLETDPFALFGFLNFFDGLDLC